LLSESGHSDDIFTQQLDLLTWSYQMPLDLGVRIRQARIQAGMTQSELAKQIGVHRSAVAQWESNKRSNPTTHHLELIAQCTEVRFEWLATSRGQIKVDPDEVAMAITMNVFARDSLEVTLLEWFREIPVRARMSFIEHLRAMNPAPTGKLKKTKETKKVNWKI
jgi:transcriptional regulator with XRE-family HTH domain